jgi:hypothetical protein
MAIIDSLFHKYYVPPVVVAISKDPIDGYETLRVNGKQRLTRTPSLSVKTFPCHPRKM